MKNLGGNPDKFGIPEKGQKFKNLEM